MAEKKKAVSFTASELSEGKSKKQPPTQKYDRKEIQKRLDIENWMDEELKRIYAVEDNDEYPQLDVDDVLKIDEELRRQRLRDLLQTAKEPVEARTWGGARAVCGRCATTYFAVYTDVCNFPLCSTSPCTGSLGSPMGCPRCHPCHGLSMVPPLSWVVLGVTLVMGCPRCHPCHGLSKVSPLSCVAQGVTLVSRWSLLHVHILYVFILQGLAATCIVADSVLNLTHLVSLALSKDHTTIIHTHLYVRMYISLFCVSCC